MIKTILLQLFLLLMVGCTPTPTDPAKDLAAAQKYAQVLFGEQFTGPVCAPDHGRTICTIGQKTDTGIKPLIISCQYGNCVTDVNYTVTPAQAKAFSDADYTDELLLWFALSSSGRTTHSYHDWSSQTPEYAKQNYYSSSYKPHSDIIKSSTNYYRSSGSTTKSAYKPSGSSYYSKPTSTSYSTSKSSGSSYKRSTGYKSSGSRSTGYSSRRR